MLSCGQVQKTDGQGRARERRFQCAKTTPLLFPPLFSEICRRVNPRDGIETRAGDGCQCAICSMLTWKRNLSPDLKSRLAIANCPHTRHARIECAMREMAFVMSAASFSFSSPDHPAIVVCTMTMGKRRRRESGEGKKGRIERARAQRGRQWFRNMDVSRTPTPRRKRVRRPEVRDGRGTKCAQSILFHST